MHHRRQHALGGKDQHDTTEYPGAPLNPTSRSGGDPSPAGSADSTGSRLRSTRRKRAVFALPVVIIGFGSACASPGHGVISNPPPPSTTPSTEPPTSGSIIMNPPLPTSTTAVPPPVVVSNPPPPSTASPTSSRVIVNPPWPSTTKPPPTIIINPPPPTVVPNSGPGL